ncbi:MAG: hypothetical protein KDE19_02340 [Caldilineaceae bacterium]|nr:hypothetical protein [Caldilineaceae bacterium]
MPLGICLILGWIVSGCTAEPPAVVNAPTLVPVFQSETGAVTPTATPTLRPVVMAAPTAVVATATPSYREVVVFDEGLQPGWTVSYSEEVTLDQQDTTHWFEALDRADDIDAGAVSMLVTPEEGWGTIRFTLQPDAAVSYPRAEVQGVSFWINSNNSFMSNDALVVTIVGSNDNPYWQPNDTSALTKVGYFPEIPLYDLAVNDAIPPNTWVRVILSMDKLLFGPEYEYVTGIVIKSKSFQTRPFHIDRVALLVTP